MKKRVIIVLAGLLLFSFFAYSQKTKVKIVEVEWNIDTDLVPDQEYIGDKWGELLQLNEDKYESKYGSGHGQYSIWSHMTLFMPEIRTFSFDENQVYGAGHVSCNQFRNRVFERTTEYLPALGGRVTSDLDFTIEFWSYLTLQTTPGGDYTYLESNKLGDITIHASGKKMNIKLFVNYKNGQWTLAYETISQY